VVLVEVELPLVADLDLELVEPEFQVKETMVETAQLAVLELVVAVVKVLPDLLVSAWLEVMVELVQSSQ
jgi:hypothetical protein